MTDDAKEYEQLFADYIKVCNQALAENKEVFPYKQLANTTEGLLGGNRVKIVMYDDRPKACYALRLNDSNISSTQINDPEHTKEAWRVNYTYLKRVVENPEDYIKHPAKLDWDWLKSRLGL